ncbi:PDR/VanB family oxidoreductase [Pseudalkalibacillus decolorationis]|uniref:PDR/VanB family oxidoreductase n=1 Tax=Pseudalkalibacillus decolorationis TaxID=163879 RepID=UPI002147E84A|nr:PDR/VanB family oxidoreductase [Pseudalkalibacillus decolorationis]
MNEPMELQVKQIKKETDLVKTFVLGSDYCNLPTFGPGSHLPLHLPMGLRHYSIINNPLQSSSEFMIAVKKISGYNSGSTYLHEQIEEGEHITISPPDNYFPLHLKAKHHVFYAAGIGITPVLSMLSYLKTIGHSYELHYSARSIEECAFYDYIQAEFRNHSTFYFMERSKRMKQMKESLLHRKVGTHIYVCGPQTFMDALVMYAKEQSYPRNHIHVERFKSLGNKQVRSDFTVSLVKKNETFKVRADQSLLEALLERGIEQPHACRMGICGTCEVEYTDGEIEHLDSFLTKEEKKNKLLSCVSRGCNHLRINL